VLTGVARSDLMFPLLGTPVIIERVGIVSSAGQSGELQRALFALVGPTSVEPGCIGCSLYTEAGNPHKFCLETRWRSEVDLVKHLRSEQYRNLLILIELGKEPPIVEFHDVSKTQGLELVAAVRRDPV
jgi:quinol monooxygenase YgiN